MILDSLIVLTAPCKGTRWSALLVGATDSTTHGGPHCSNLLSTKLVPQQQPNEYDNQTSYNWHGRLTLQVTPGALKNFKL